MTVLWTAVDVLCLVAGFHVGMELIATWPVFRRWFPVVGIAFCLIDGQGTTVRTLWANGVYFGGVWLLGYYLRTDQVVA